MTDTIGRMPRPAASTHNAVRATTVVAVSMVATVAAAVSFMHMHELAARAGEGWRAWLVPLAVDGLVVAASMTMLIRRRAGKPAGWLAWVSMGAGITASLAANVAAAEPTFIGRAVAAWPPLALVLAYELLMEQVRTNARQQPAQSWPGEHAAMPASPSPASTPATTISAPAPETATIPARVARAVNGDRHTALSGIDGKGAAHGTAHPDGNDTVPSGPILRTVRHADAVEATRHAARQYVRQTVADGQPCTGKQLAEQFGMSERWGRYQIRAARRALTLARVEPVTS